MTFRFEIEVLKYNTYGDKVAVRTPMSVLAEDKNEVTEKVRAAFNATYDSFRNFWSHSWVLNSVNEEPAALAAEVPGRLYVTGEYSINDGQTLLGLSDGRRIIYKEQTDWQKLPMEEKGT